MWLPIQYKTCASKDITDNETMTDKKNVSGKKETIITDFVE